MFVIEWTPALSSAIAINTSVSVNIPKTTIPHGIIFASFMVSYRFIFFLFNLETMTVVFILLNSCVEIIEIL